MAILLPEERLGERVAGRYRLDAILSTGGMGVLFEAYDEDAGRPVAVKMLKPAYALEPGRVARFLRETRIAVQLRHPNIATVLDVWTDGSKTPFLIMELLSGRSLGQELEIRGTLPVREALAIAIPVGHALVAAHEMGVIHRDIKPGNIFLCRDLRHESDAESAPGVVPKLLDFGIAKSARDDFETETGMLVGTPGYMAPEQVLYGECGPFTDVWGLGAVLYRCLMGRPPHAGDSVPDVMRRLISEQVAPVDVPGVSKALCATVDRALARQPHARHPSMKAFVHALQAATTSRPVESSTEATQTCEAPEREFELKAIAQSRSKRARFVVPTLLTVALLSSGLLLLARKPEGVRGADTSQATRRDESSGKSAMLPSPSFLDDTRLELRVPEPGSTEATVVPSSVDPSDSRPRPPVASRRPTRARPAPLSTSTTVPDASALEEVEREATTGLPIITRW